MRRTLMTWSWLLLAAAASAGCKPGPGFTTELSVTRGLRGGDAVTRDGNKIGSVTDIKSLADGNYEVGFAVSSSEAAEVRRDSIAVLRAEGGPPHLEIMTPNPSSPAAAPGSRIAGAATDAELALLQGRGQLQGLAGSLAGMIQSLNTNLEALNRSPAWEQFHKELDDVQNQVMHAGERSAEILNREIPRLEDQFKSLERQLLAAGKSAEAQHLRDQLDRLERQLRLSQAPAPPPTPGP